MLIFGLFLFIFPGISSVLVTKCNYYSNSDYDYKNFIKISDIKNSQPDGFILRIILYIQGARDGNILLATSDHPNFERDFVYEFGKFLYLVYIWWFSFAWHLSRSIEKFTNIFYVLFFFLFFFPLISFAMTCVHLQ